MRALVCASWKKKPQGVLIWMAVARSGLAGRCAGWSIRLCWGLITRWLILNPCRTIGPSPVMPGCTTMAALTTHYKQTARSKMVHCLSELAALLTCILPQKDAPLYPQLTLTVKNKNKINIGNVLECSAACRALERNCQSFFFRNYAKYFPLEENFQKTCMRSRHDFRQVTTT